MWFHLRRHGAPRGRHPNEHEVPVGGLKGIIRSPDEDRKPIINTMSVVAALIATLTFAAAFTMPGGYNSGPDNLGGATLVKKAALRAFILSDTLAMCCSITVVSLLWTAMRVEEDLKFSLTNTSMILLNIALCATLVAFMSGVFAVIAPKALWVAILVCIICSMIFLFNNPRKSYEIFTFCLVYANRDYQRHSSFYTSNTAEEQKKEGPAVCSITNRKRLSGYYLLFK
ncbi:hypothetical protein Vadar_029648 [Vaccinium darrowii]|uniref:Uncharacterized protein n=1 Tax=Vaccinium darrowii TaxID=229202 RepID=A0ACB7XV23_9ERIC|nr:hypothetical protein Vadar_029648 [Vaccinium darrowii]